MAKTNSVGQGAREVYGAVGIDGEVPIEGTAISIKAVTISTIGDNTIHTPAAGNRIELGYLAISADGGNSADVIATVKFGAAGAAIYKVSLKAGSIYARNIGAGNRFGDSGLDTALVVSLSANQTVHVSVEYDEAL